MTNVYEKSGFGQIFQRFIGEIELKSVKSTRQQLHRQHVEDINRR